MYERYAIYIMYMHTHIMYTHAYTQTKLTKEWLEIPFFVSGIPQRCQVFFFKLEKEENILEIYLENCYPGSLTYSRG